MLGPKEVHRSVSVRTKRLRKAVLLLCFYFDKKGKWETACSDSKSYKKAKVPRDDPCSKFGILQLSNHRAENSDQENIRPWTQQL
jgi:hypothetical protein